LKRDVTWRKTFCFAQVVPLRIACYNQIVIINSCENNGSISYLGYAIGRSYYRWCISGKLTLSLSVAQDRFTFYELVLIITPDRYSYRGFKASLALCHSRVLSLLLQGYDLWTRFYKLQEVWENDCLLDFFVIERASRFCVS